MGFLGWKTLTSMMPGSNVRGAGLALLARRFPTAGAQENIEIFEKVRQMVDLPEVIPLVEQGLFDGPRRCDSTRRPSSFLWAKLAQS